MTGHCAEDCVLGSRGSYRLVLVNGTSLTLNLLGRRSLPFKYLAPRVAYVGGRSVS
jgi:hypothetical protein